MGEYQTEDLVGTHHLQMGSTGDEMDGTKLAGRSGTRPAFWGYCAHCKWAIGGQDTTRAVKRAYARHLASAARKEAK